MQLIHRAIPYPVLLVTQAPTGTVLSLAHKRASPGEAGKWVVADGAVAHAFNPAQPTAAETEFMASLALEQLPPNALADLRALYQAVADRITALAVAQVTAECINRTKRQALVDGIKYRRLAPRPTAARSTPRSCSSRRSSLAT